MLRLYRAARGVFDATVWLTPSGRTSKRRMLQLYSAFVKPGDLCFDIGANVGTRTQLFLELGARVVAVEPQMVCLRKLQRHYGSDSRVILVPQALGRQPGEAEMLVSDAHTISSMSRDWINRVEASGRFGSHRWTSRVSVPVTTLDALIEEHGVPAFCKIDVEGYEAEVVAGLSRALPCVSFEFTPEVMETAYACVDRLGELGTTAFNYSLGETMELALPHWVDRVEMAETLRRLEESSTFGDVYAIEK